MFAILASKDLTIPNIGVVESPAFRDGSLVVVYENERAHRGNGKWLLTAEDARKFFPGCLASEFVYTNDTSCSGKSWRLLRIGSRTFWLEYRSQDNWKSNCGEVSVRLLDTKPEGLPGIELEYPLFAVDFVPDGQMLWAIDLNIAPGIRGTGVEDILKPMGIAEEIKRWFLPRGS